jgi:subtilase family serine protease
MIRRLSAFLLTIASLVPVANIVCQAQELTPLTHHVRDVVLNGQAKFVGRVPAMQSMRLVLVLPLRNQSALDSFLKELSDPSSANYRQFLTVEEFTDRFGPSQQDYDAVVRFAQAHGLTVVGTSRNRMNVDVTGTAANIEEAFHLTMGVYQHTTENRTFYAPDREPMPDLAVPLWHISGLDNYSTPRPALGHRQPNVSPKATVGSGPSGAFLGSDMRAAYYGGTALTGSGQSLGLLEYYGTDLADLNTYFKNAGETNNVPIILLSTDGTSTSCLESSGCDDTEQTLDMTQALGMAPGLSALVMYVGSSDSSIFNAMATASPLNAQLSSSWTWSPADPSTDNPYFEEFAAQGQNLFQAAGDDSAWKSSSEIYPADDVYLTSVGGTDLETTGAGGSWISETAWSDGGGGISPDEYAIPSWQVTAAAGCSGCSQTYRNAPDVSANANFTFYVCADQTTCTANEYGGTSFAAPMWAGYLALANQQAMANTGKTVGFINPTLYSIGLGSSYDSDFHDITGGSNGYSATTGFDLATGWGSPNGSGLINALAGASTPGFSLSSSPSSVSVTQGSSGTTTITSAVTGGFDSAVILTATGQPTGVTVGFSPSAITGAGTSVLTLTAASSTATGTYSITVTGTSGSTTETAKVSLKVTASASPNFTISASPNSVSVVRGKSGTSKVTTTVSGGFDSAVALTASGQPAGVTVSFSPTSIAVPGSGTSTVTMAVASSTGAGIYTITLKGTGGGITHTATVSLTVTAPATGAFTISVSPSAGYLYQGQSGYAVITTKVSGGFDSAIALSATGQPTGVTVSFSPGSIAAPGSGTSDMNLSVARTAPAGTYPITITSTGGGVTHTATLSFEVKTR